MYCRWIRALTLTFAPFGYSGRKMMYEGLEADSAKIDWLMLRCIQRYIVDKSIPLKTCWEMSSATFDVISKFWKWSCISCRKQSFTVCSNHLKRRQKWNFASKWFFWGNWKLSSQISKTSSPKNQCSLSVFSFKNLNSLRYSDKWMRILKKQLSWF